jgi:hypothetical protein
MKRRRETPFHPDDHDRFHAKQNDIRIVGHVDVKPWKGRDGLVYPEHMRDKVKPEDVETEDE